MSSRAITTPRRPKATKKDKSDNDDDTMTSRNCLRHHHQQQQQRHRRHGNQQTTAAVRRSSRDSEQTVVAETDCVFRNFVYQMYVNDVTSRTDDELPSLPEVRKLREQPVTPLAEIGRQLAAVGDDINERYRPQFNRLIRSLNITPETAYDLFAEVARKLFDDGTVNWGRVVTLLCFGYQMAMSVIRRGLSGFFSNIARFMVRFILLENIAKWIADQGGWRAVVDYIPESIGWSTLGLIFALSALSVITVIALSRNQ